MKRLLLPIIFAISLLGGCLTTDYNLRVLYDTDRAYIHPDSSQYGMKWHTPAWRTKNLKYWSSAGVIVTNWYNVFEENDWLKYAIANGFEGTVLIQQDFSATPVGMFSYPSGSFAHDYYLLATSQFPNFQTSIGGGLILVSDSSVIGSTPETAYDVLTMKPSVMNTLSYRESLAQLYVEHIQSTMTELGITNSNKVNFGVLFDEYGYSDWTWGNKLTSLGYEFDPTGGSTNWNSQTPEDRHSYLSTPQSNLIDAFYDAGIKVVVKGDRLETELLANTDLQSGKIIGYMFNDVTSETIDGIKTTAATLRTYETALSPEESLMLIAGVKSDVYYSSKPTVYATLIRNIVNDGMYFTSGSNGYDYWNAPATNPGDWWVRSNKDSNWQSQAPTYASDSVGPRKTMIPMETTFGQTYTNTWTCDEPVASTKYIFPTNTASTDSGSIDFSFVYDENTNIFHIIQIPGAFYDWGGRLIDRNYTDYNYQENRMAWFQHFTSTDLVNWTKQPNINMYDSSYGKTNVWAPHIIKYGNIWYMFYTGTDATSGLSSHTERILLSTSSDLYTWSSPTLVLEGDDYDTGVTPFTNWTTGTPNWTNDCRDAFVVRNESNTGWLMFVSLSGNGAVVGDGGMVIGIARSTDIAGPYKLYDYIKQTSTPRYNELIPGTPGAGCSGPVGGCPYGQYSESPQIWVEDGTYYLQVSTNDEQVGVVTKSTTPSEGWTTDNTSWSTLEFFPYKATEMLTLKSGDRILTSLVYHPSLKQPVWDQYYLIIEFKRYQAVPSGTDLFYNQFLPSCYDGSPFFTPVTIPAQPTGLGVVATSTTSAKLYWTPATYGDVFSYNIYRGTSSGGETLLDNTTETRRYLDTGLTDNQPYYYKIKAVNYDGTESPFSAEVTVTP